MQRKNIAEAKIKLTNLGGTAGAWLLDQIGETREVTLSDGTKTMSCILKMLKLEDFCERYSIDFRKILNENYGQHKKDKLVAKGQPAFVESEYSDNNSEGCLRNGYLVNLDLYQQTALLREIVKVFPELEKTLGLYNLRASQKVFEVLKKAAVDTLKNLLWFFTGETFDQEEYDSLGQDSRKYEESKNRPQEGLVFIDKLTKEILDAHRVCYRHIANDDWDRSDSRCYDYRRPFILGALILK